MKCRWTVTDESENRKVKVVGLTGEVALVVSLILFQM